MSQENVRFFSFFLQKSLIFFLLSRFMFQRHITLAILHSTLYTIHSTLITHSLYLKLRFPSLICSFKSPCKIPRKNQRRTKDEEVPRMALRVLRPKSPHSEEKRSTQNKEKNSQTEKVHFILHTDNFQQFVVVILQRN